VKKPLIGINPYYFQYGGAFWNATKEKYYQAVWLGGGIPVTVHYDSSDRGIEDIVSTCDGFVMVGGPDLPSDIYGGERPDLLDEDVMDSKRVAFDRDLFFSAKKAGKPILSICAGFQYVNVLYGGTLYEDLQTQNPGKVNHGKFNGKWSEHTVRLETKSLIRNVMGMEEPLVISTHHQGVRELGKGLLAVARSNDGLVEAIEDESDPNAFLAVQWHPELGIQYQEQLRLFQWVVQEAESRKRQ
jgi:putative glutamine amidotransferase